MKKPNGEWTGMIGQILRRVSAMINYLKLYYIYIKNILSASLQDAVGFKAFLIELIEVSVE